jgi:hypothetical protein
LAHLADRATLERELAGTEHRLLPDRHRLEPERPIALEVRVGRAHHREPPPVRVHDPPQLREQVVDLSIVADRVPADEGGSRDDAIGEEGAARRREEIALVASQGEEREAVTPVFVHQRPRHAPLRDGLRDGMAERPQPEVEGEKTADEAKAETRSAGSR